VYCNVIHGQNGLTVEKIFIMRNTNKKCPIISKILSPGKIFNVISKLVVIVLP